MNLLVEVEVEIYDYYSYDSEIEYLSEDEKELEYEGTKIITKTLMVPNNLSFTELQKYILDKVRPNKYCKSKRIISWTRCS